MSDKRDSSGMEKMNTALSLVNVGYTTLVAFYFYRSNTSLQSQIVNLSEMLSSTIAEVGRLKQQIDEIKGIKGEIRKFDIGMHNIAHTIDDIKKDVEDNPTMEEFEEFMEQFEDMRSEIDVMKTSMEETGITFPEVPKKKREKSKSPKKVPASDSQKKVKWSKPGRRRSTSEEEEVLEKRRPGGMRRDRHESNSRKEEIEENEDEDDFDPVEVAAELRRTRARNSRIERGRSGRS